jgi:hypothetical protein
MQSLVVPNKKIQARAAPRLPMLVSLPGNKCPEKTQLRSSIGYFTAVFFSSNSGKIIWNAFMA